MRVRGLSVDRAGRKAALDCASCCDACDCRLTSAWYADALSASRALWVPCSMILPHCSQIHRSQAFDRAQSWTWRHFASCSGKHCFTCCYSSPPDRHSCVPDADEELGVLQLTEATALSCDMLQGIGLCSGR